MSARGNTDFCPELSLLFSHTLSCVKTRHLLLALSCATSPLLAACGDTFQNASESSIVTLPVTDSSSVNPSLPTTTESATTSSTTTSVISQQTPVGVYFIKNEFMAVVGRLVETPDIDAALHSLLLGPTAVEIQDGVTSFIPVGTRLLNVDIADSTAFIDLSHEFATGGGSLSMMGRIAEVVYTATAFAEIDRVTIRIDGVLVEQIGGEGIDVSEITRTDLIDFSPLILVDSPVPHEVVSRDIHMTGMSNTYEAGINYQVISPDGTVIYEGYTMATSGTGTWGTFDHIIETLPESVVGDVVLKVFEYSPKDSEPINAVFIPLTIE